MENNEQNQLNRVEIARDLPYHNHDGINSPKIPARFITPVFILTPTQLTDYLAGNTTEGTSFSVYDGTNYYFYVRINSNWKRCQLT